MEFTIKARFKTTPEELYNAWLDSAKHSEMTGGEADVSTSPGELFQAWDGYIQGENLILEPGRKIVQSWRTTEFAEDEADSKIEILLESETDETILTLIHTSLPKHGEQYKKGWEEHYFEPMRKYFGT